MSLAGLGWNPSVIDRPICQSEGSWLLSAAMGLLGWKWLLGSNRGEGTPRTPRRVETQ